MHIFELKYTPGRDFFQKNHKIFFSFTEKIKYILNCLHRCVVSKKYLIMHTAYIFSEQM